MGLKLTSSTDIGCWNISSLNNSLVAKALVDFQRRVDSSESDEPPSTNSREWLMVRPSILSLLKVEIWMGSECPRFCFRMNLDTLTLQSTKLTLVKYYIPGQQPLRRPPLTGREEEQRTAATDFVGAGYH